MPHDSQGNLSKVYVSHKGVRSGGQRFARGALYRILKNRLYLGEIVHKGTPYPGEHQPIIDADPWEQAQRILTDNRSHRLDGTRARYPSLLGGLLFDDQGNYLSPSHTVKNGRRYRYYVNQALIQFRPQDASTVKRIPAHEIESLVCRAIRSFLTDPLLLLDGLLPRSAVGEKQGQVLVRAQRIAEGWDSMSPADLSSLIHTILRAANIGDDVIELKLARAGLAKVLGFDGIDRTPPGDDDYEVASFRIQARLKRVGGESKLILHARDQDPPASQQSPALIEAIVLAHAWSKASFADSSLTGERIAVNAGMSKRYVARIMRLAYLAPDITQAILDGTQPRRLSLHRLFAGAPLSWSEQRATFGFQRR